MRKTLFVTVLALCLGAMTAALLVGCGGSGGTGGDGSNQNPPSDETTGTTEGGTVVVEKDVAFEPATVTVKAGETVTFKNEDSVAHEVEIDGKTLGLQSSGDEVRWTASKAGTYPFTCTIHPSMTGEVTVE